jgi:peroxiredoxin/regulation of enolase protein 1 (concanavalin A-like superfamily)
MKRCTDVVMLLLTGSLIAVQSGGNTSRGEAPRGADVIVAEEPVVAPPSVEAPLPTVEQPRPSPARTTVPEQNLRIPEEMQACAANLRKISAAIKKYEKDKGRLPDWLSDLVPQYLDKGLLVCPVTRNERALYWPDPKLPCSYNYEFSPTRLSGDWGPISGMTVREWKTSQRKLFGDVVPTVRCPHGALRLNLSVGGQVYWSPDVWETLFMPEYRRGDELAVGPSSRQPRQPRVAFDGFNGKLALQWQIRNADPSHVSLTKRPGTLTITTQEGGFHGANTNYKNLFLIENPVPEGRNFEVTTCLVAFAPNAAYQQAGLVCWNDQDNYIKWGYESGGTEGARLALIRETAGSSIHAYAGAAARAEKRWLRLTKRGRYYIYSSSTDGKQFLVYGEQLWGDGAPKYVGLVAKNAAGTDAPEIDASFDSFEIREKLVVERPVDRYALPAGGVDELLTFVENLRNFRPQTDWEAAEHQRRAPAVLRAAATRILSLEKDEQSRAFQTALLVLLEDRVRTIEGTGGEQQRQILDYVKTFLTAKVEKGLQPEDVDLAISTGWALESSGNLALAAQAYADFARLVGQSKDEKLSARRHTLEGAVRRFGLPGKEMRLEGTKLDGSTFDGSAYRGKVVLVYFWTSGSDVCRAELASVKRDYQLYHDRGFDVVGISTDGDRQALEEFLKKEQLPWVTLHEKDPGATQPTAAHYGVTGVPTALLVGKEGKVVSLRARGGERDRLLQQLLGPPYVPKGKLAYIDLQPKANQKLAEPFDATGRPNNLGELPQGEQTFGGVKFKVADHMIHLGNSQQPNWPKKVEGIRVNQSVARLYIFQGAGWAFPPDGTMIGQYKVHYQDETEATIPIVLGEDVRDWWDNDGSKAVTRGKVVWAGQNAASRAEDKSLRLYLAAWENPHPEKKVVSIDLISANASDAAPFCVAITAEEAAGPVTDQ